MRLRRFTRLVWALLLAGNAALTSTALGLTVAATENLTNVLLGQASTSDLVACSASPKSTYSGGINVLLVFSNCVEDLTLESVNDWAANMKRIVKDTAKLDALNFQSTVVPGACKPSSTSTAAQETIDLNRLRTYPALSATQSLAKTKSTSNSQTTVISFATDSTSFDAITSLESTAKVTNLMNFHTSSSAETCGGANKNCFKLKANDDLFLYNTIPSR